MQTGVIGSSIHPYIKLDHWSTGHHSVLPLTPRIPSDQGRSPISRQTLTAAMKSQLACLLVLACLCASTLAGGYGMGVMPFGLGLGLGGYGMGLGLGGLYGGYGMGMGLGYGGMYGGYGYGMGMGFGYPGMYRFGKYY